MLQLLALQNVELHLAGIGVVGHTPDRRPIGRKRLQRTQIRGRLHGDAAAFVDKDLADQIQRLLRPRGDQHLIGRNIPRQRLRHPLAQRLVAFAGGVLQRIARLRAHDFFVSRVECVNRKRVWRRQAARKADDVRLLGHFEDVPQHRGIHAGGAGGQIPVFHGRVLVR